MNIHSIAVLVLAAVLFPIQNQQPTDKPAGKVLICGAGMEPHLQTLMDGLTDFLKEQGVAVKQVETEGKSRSTCLERLKEQRGESLVYVTLDMALGQPKDTVTVQCFGTEGKELWKEKASGGFGPFHSAGGTVSKMLKSLRKKIEPRIGKPGLPKDKQSVVGHRNRSIPAVRETSSSCSAWDMKRAGWNRL